MRKAFTSIIAIGALAILCTFTSCEPEPCELVSCAQGGICDEGSCICQIGFEGIYCETEARKKFIDNGIYQVNENGTLQPEAQYNTNIVAGPESNEVFLKNVRNGQFDGYDVLANVALDTIWIPLQNTGNGYRIEGRGIITETNPVGTHYYDDAIIKLTYRVTNLSDNSVDQYGTNGSQPSDWSKN